MNRTVTDYHIHTKASPDAKGTMRQYVKKAKRRGIVEIGFSEHVSLSHMGGCPDLFVQLMPIYVRDFLDFREKSELPIKLGAEVDFLGSETEKAKEFVQKYPFDYVIGSVHMIGNWIIDDPSQVDEYSKRGVSKAYEEYFHVVKQLCSCRLFDILGHPDLIKIFGAIPRTGFSHILTETAEAMAESNICAEINTKGLRRPCREIFPSEQFLKILHSYNVPIAFGSDAHQPSEVGRDFAKALKLAKKVGYASACVFDCRERSPVKI